MNKKALSLLLALSMVFSMNTAAFAGTTSQNSASDNKATQTENAQSSNSANAQSENVSATVSQETVVVGGYTLTLSFNKTPLATGKKIVAEQLNATLSVSGSGVSVNSLAVTKVKTKAKSTGSAAFTIKKVNVKSLTKDQKKAVKKALKAAKKTEFKIDVKKFSVSYNDVSVFVGKKPSTISGNYAVTVNPNKKGTKATVKVWYKKANGKFKGIKVKKSSATYSNKAVKLSGDFEGTISVNGTVATKA